MKVISLRRYLVLHALFVFIFVMSGNTLHGSSIMAKPGKLKAFVLHMPEKILAGEGIVVTIKAHDAYGNLIKDFDKTSKKDFEATVSGSAYVQPSILKASSFVGGGTTVTLTDKKAEKITLSISEIGSSGTIVTEDITVLHNKLNHFAVEAPSAAKAGERFDVKLIAEDIFNNTVTDYKKTGGVKITSRGTTTLEVLSTSLDFKNGVAIVSVVGKKSGETAVEVNDSLTNSKGQSGKIIINPAILSYFKVNAPPDVTAGEPFDVTLHAYDAFDNPVDYSLSGNGVNLISTGQNKLAPFSVSRAEFKGSQTTVAAKYERAEDIAIIVKEKDDKQEGRSNLIKIKNSFPEQFVVVSPNEITAGDEFNIKIEIYDRYKNPVKNFNVIGGNVRLSASGTGILSPNIVSFQSFVEGLANVKVVYDKAESFIISADMVSPKAFEKIPYGKPKEEKIKPPKKTKKSKKAYIEKEISPQTEIEPAKIQEEKPVVIPDKVGTTRNREAAKAETPEKAAKEEPLKEIEGKTEPVQPFELKSITTVDDKDKVLIYLGLEEGKNELVYETDIISIVGEKEDWLKVTVKPATKGALRPIKRIKSAFTTGRIRIEEDKTQQNVLNIMFELTPYKDRTIKISKDLGYIIVSITTP